ncbi:peptidase [Streptosporangium carneum]|uniref:Peptidase n=1 Tax=Streptosporangium carneum TaxID=47481 RepID=A0A9W6IAJ0_9ACTN|nr:peptidase [Streptosporangium carneum]
MTAAAVLATAVATVPPAFAEPVTTAGAVARGTLDGVWKSDGYGMVLAIEDGRLRLYQTTSISCLPAGTMKRRGPARGGTVAFGGSGLPTLTLRADGRDRARARYTGALTPLGLLRLRALPEQCSKPTPKDPVTTFDVFWTTFAENYLDFGAKGVDWRAVRDRYRPRVNANTSDERLFEILTAMIKPLGDAHTGVSWDDEHFYFGGRPGTRAHEPLAELRARVDKAVARNLGAPLRTWANGEVGYADLPDGLGYLRVTGMAGYTKGAGGLAADRAELDRALDAVFTASRVRDLRGLIVDVRYNTGGYDDLGLRIASRLTGRPYTAYTKRARNHPADPARFTRPGTITVKPARAPIYTGPVAVLTGDLTVSAGETFVMGLMERGPEPLRIGVETQGAFSDILSRTLPNGWQFGLSNEDYRTRAGRTFEGAGIPPHVRTPVFTDEELDSGRDSALDEARARLKAAGTDASTAIGTGKGAAAR